MIALRRAYKSAARKLGAESQGPAATVMCGGQWTRERLWEAGAQVIPVCSRCYKARETEYQRMWECEANANLPECKDSQPWATAVEAGSKEAPCLWLRGLVPREASEDISPPPAAETAPVA